MSWPRTGYNAETQMWRDPVSKGYAAHRIKVPGNPSGGSFTMLPTLKQFVLDHANVEKFRPRYDQLLHELDVDDNTVPTWESIKNDPTRISIWENHAATVGTTFEDDPPKAPRDRKVKKVKKEEPIKSGVYIVSTNKTRSGAVKVPKDNKNIVALCRGFHKQTEEDTGKLMMWFDEDMIILGLPAEGGSEDPKFNSVIGALTDQEMQAHGNCLLIALRKLD